MNISTEGNIYAFNAEAVLAEFASHLVGDANDVLLVVSSDVLDSAAEAAIQASAERLGFGRDRTAWARVAGTSPEAADSALTADELRRLVEGVDPVAIIAVDGKASSLVSAAYQVPFTLDNVNRAAGRIVLAFSNFAGMLDNKEDKQKAWHLLKKLR